jgi:hypothetical protein
MKLNEWLSKYGFTFTQYDLEAVLEVSDSDHNGSLSKQEFTHAILSISEGVQATTIMELHQAVMMIQSKVVRTEILLTDWFAGGGGGGLVRAATLQNQEQIPCPSGCGYQVTWHATHCCGRCATGMGHGERCDRRFVTLPEMKEETPESRLDRKIGAVMDWIEQEKNERARIAMEKILDPPKILKSGMASQENVNTNVNIISLDTRLALKIDSCEAMVREIRRKVAELAADTHEFVRAQASSITVPEPGRLLTDSEMFLSKGLLDNISIPDPWSELEFEAPLEIPDVWEIAGRPKCSPQAQDQASPQSGTRKLLEGT